MNLSTLLARFYEEPGSHIFLDPDYNIVEVGPSYLRATMTKRHNLIGQNILDIFPDNPNLSDANGVANLKASLDRVKETLEPDKMDVQRYDIRNFDGEWVERWWIMANIPVCEGGDLKYIAQRVEDITTQKVLERRMASTDRKNYVLYSLVIILFGLLSYLYVHNNERQNNFARQTCEIQKNALPAGRQLAASMIDIHTLITPKTAREKKRLNQIPPDLRATYSDLSYHLGKYQADIRKQPLSRRCATP